MYNYMYACVSLFSLFLSLSFCLGCAGDYDAILVLMLLPRIIFKAEIVIDHLKQQVTTPLILRVYKYIYM